MSLDALRDLPGLFQLRRRRYRKRFIEQEFGTFWGVFPTFDAALVSLPPALASGYHDPTLVDFHLDQFLRVMPFDWPVLFFLSRLLRNPQVTSLVDFGGHVGAKYYAYRDLLDLPDTFTWNVVDLPPMVAEGRRRSRSQEAAHLTFFEDIGDAPACDILLCSGVLQFCRFTIADIIDRCAAPPATVILNKVPFCRSGAFVTLENFNRVKVGYQIFDRTAHDTLRESLGYDLVRRWRIPHRDFDIPFARPARPVKMFGEIWRRAGSDVPQLSAAGLPVADSTPITAKSELAGLDAVET